MMIRIVYSTLMLPMLLVSTVDATELQLRSSRRLQQAGPASVLSMIERDIRDLIRFRREDADAGNVDLRPKILRLGFHDCVGGCDGCVDLTNADNNGLDVPIQALQPIVDQYVNNPEIEALLGDGVTLSRADIWAFATLLSADSSEDSDIGTFPMQFLGRIDCENKGGACFDADGVTEVPCTSTRGPHRELPGPNLNTHQLLQFFSSNFGFDARMTVAIMGAHSIGQMTRTNSGFEGSWVGNERRLDNGYYAQLVGGEGDTPPENENILRHAPNWNVEELINTDLENIPDRVQWERGDLAMLNSDIAIVRDLSSQNEDIPGMEFLDENTGIDQCTFKCRPARPGDPDEEEFGCPNQNPPACPLARMTLEIAAEYKFSLTSWVQDFEEALIRMLHQGYEYDTSADCQPTSPCLLTPNDVNNDNIESPTSAPTLSPTPSPTESPTPVPTTAPTAAVVPTTPSPTATGNDGGGEGDDDDNCLDSSDKFNFVNKKDLTKIVTDKKCSWVAKKWNKRCGKFLLEDDTSKKAKHICPRACGVCIPEGLECSPLTKKKCKQNAGCKYDKTDDTCVNRN